MCNIKIKIKLKQHYISIFIYQNMIQYETTVLIKAPVSYLEQTVINIVSPQMFINKQ